MTGSEHDRRKYEDIRRRKVIYDEGEERISRIYHTSSPPPPNPWRAQSLPPSSAAGPLGESGGAREEGRSEEGRGAERHRRGAERMAACM